MSPRGATALTLTLAAAALFVPRWLYGGASAVSHSALRFELLSHDFGEVLEGEEVVFEFPYRNTLDAPLNIDRVRHCGCIRLEGTSDTIAAGQPGVLRVHLDSRNRTGRQVKPIDLMTDEPGGGEAKLVVTGMVRSPLILRQNRILVQGALPGETSQHTLPVRANDQVADVKVQDLEGDFLNATLQPDGDAAWRLNVEVRAPAQPGSSTGAVTLSCVTDGRTWTKSVPVRVVVPQPFRTLPPNRLTLRGGEATLIVMSDDPGRGKVTGFEASVPGLVVSEAQRSDRLLKLRVQLADGITALPADAAVRVLTDHPAFPALVVPVVLADG